MVEILEMPAEQPGREKVEKWPEANSCAEKEYGGNNGGQNDNEEWVDASSELGEDEGRRGTVSKKKYESKDETFDDAKEGWDEEVGGEHRLSEPTDAGYVSSTESQYASDERNCEKHQKNDDKHQKNDEKRQKSEEQNQQIDEKHDKNVHEDNDETHDEKREKSIEDNQGVEKQDEEDDEKDGKAVHSNEQYGENDETNEESEYGSETSADKSGDEETGTENKINKNDIISEEEIDIIKNEANQLYKSGDYIQAMETYSYGISLCPRQYTRPKAILFSNRAATHQQMGQNEEALHDASEAIRIDPTFAKAYMRRFRTNEKLQKWHDCVNDLKKAMELCPQTRAEHRATLMRVERESKATFEKEKEEMMGKMKELGNFLLGKVGLSTDNFKMEQNESGSYNIQFQPNSA